MRLGCCADRIRWPAGKRDVGAQSHPRRVSRLLQSLKVALGGVAHPGLPGLARGLRRQHEILEELAMERRSDVKRDYRSAEYLAKFDRLLPSGRRFLRPIG